MLWSLRSSWLSRIPQHRSFSFTPNHRLPNPTPLRPLLSFRQQLARTSKTKSFSEAVKRPSIRNQILFFGFVSFSAFHLAAELTNYDTVYWTKELMENGGAIWRSRPPTTDELQRASYFAFGKQLQAGLSTLKDAIEDFPMTIKNLLVWSYVQAAQPILNTTDGRRMCWAIGAVSGVIWLAWQFPRLKPFMMKSFTHNPLSGLSYTLLTSVFSHSSFLHLLFNCMALASFGSAASQYLINEQKNPEKSPSRLTEATVKWHLLAFFISAGLFSGLVSHVVTARFIYPRLVARLTTSLKSSATGPMASSAAAAVSSKAATSQILPSLGASGAVVFDHWAHLGGAAFGALYYAYGPQMWDRLREARLRSMLVLKERGIARRRSSSRTATLPYLCGISGCPCRCAADTHKVNFSTPFERRVAYSAIGIEVARQRVPTTAEHPDNATVDTTTLVEPNFDENVLRTLCDLDCAVPLLMDRIKQSMISCREASIFLKKRAMVEEEYGRSMQKLAKTTSDTYATNDGRLEPTSMRGNHATTDELDRLLLQKEGESVRDNALQGRSPGGVNGKRVIGKAVAKGGLLLKGRNPQNIQRQEDDVRTRMSNASDAYRKAMHDTQAIRQEFFNFQRPRILRALKECVDEIDLGVQYHLTRYAFLYESIVLSDGNILAPKEDSIIAPGLKATMESIDNRSDFKTYMQNYAYAHGGTNTRGPRRDGPRDEGYLPPIPPLQHHSMSSPSPSHVPILDRGRPTFGVDLGEQMMRDDVDVPPIMVKCCEAIEKYGLQSQGVYRISGTMTKVAKLKERLDKADLDSVDLDADEWSSDVTNITSVLKLWLRELPDPLFTSSLHNGFLEAARNENERLRHIRLHERVNDLPDPNYSTLKYFMGHLYKIVQHEAQNSMSIQNLAIIFGPTLFGQGQVNGQLNGMPAMADTSLQNKAVETILEHYTDIFVDESEG
ncbi:Rho GTPase-activating protein 23 [Grifola frondosa]|uniref:Rho GTPase-activating protein 23 n=1 Tax=Grifola frondosa TaxID=5627 RepID=A0A1C7LSF8_GRIFR|nr:Rho GTPase-activating protein 23 [Grifola frondosa]